MINDRTLHQVLDLWDKSYCSGKSLGDASEMPPLSPTQNSKYKTIPYPKENGKTSGHHQNLKACGNGDRLNILISSFNSPL